MTAEVVLPGPLEELADLWRSLPRMGEWLDDAACGALGAGADVFTASYPDPDELALAERTCRRCPVRQECSDYAAQAPVWGLWGGTWQACRGSVKRAE